jgi:ABC-2 type transport system permease protein
MSKYWLVFKLSIQDIFEYRFDFLIHVVKYAMMVLLMAVVWVAVQRESGTEIMSRQQTISYFVFAAMIYSLSNFHTVDIEIDIKLGGLTKYLVKPVVPLSYYFTQQVAVAIFETMLKAGVMIPILGLLGFLPHLDIARLLLFISFLPLIFVYAFFQFFCISSMSFWLQEAYAIRWALTGIFRFFAGILVPLSFFPTAVQNILFWTPFPHMAYTPIQLIQGNNSIEHATAGMLILTAWAAILYILARKIWHEGTHSFESTGI